jgi:hypothetical protein
MFMLHVPIERVEYEVKRRIAREMAERLLDYITIEESIDPNTMSKRIEASIHITDESTRKEFGRMKLKLDEVKEIVK